MQTDLLSIVERFAADANLSDHRAGMVLAKNGRLLERLRDPKRKIWPDTAASIRAAVVREREARGLNGDHPPSHGSTTTRAQAAPREKRRAG